MLIIFLITELLQAASGGQLGVKSLCIIPDNIEFLFINFLRGFWAKSLIHIQLYSAVNRMSKHFLIVSIVSTWTFARLNYSLD